MNWWNKRERVSGFDQVIPRRGVPQDKRGEPTGMNVVVTGGGTVAPIDDVRQIANVSTGRFSAAISEACLKRGAAVWHVHTPQAQLPFLRSARFDLTDLRHGGRARAARPIARPVANGRRSASPGPPRARRTVADYAANLEQRPPVATDRRRLPRDGGLRLRARAVTTASSIPTSRRWSFAAGRRRR